MIGDVFAAIELLKNSVSEDPLRELDMALYRAHCADKIRKRTRKASAEMGDGTLQAACYQPNFREPLDFGNKDNVEKLGLVCDAILRWRNRAGTRSRHVRKIAS